MSCIVCLQPILNEELIITLKCCRTIYHSECITPWLLRHENCPHCRAIVILQQLRHRPCSKLVVAQRSILSSIIRKYERGLGFLILLYLLLYYTIDTSNTENDRSLWWVVIVKFSLVISIICISVFSVLSNCYLVIDRVKQISSNLI